MKRVRSLIRARSPSMSSEPSSSTGATTRWAPVASVTSCQGTMLAWCSMPVISTSSPGWSIGRTNDWATRLIASVAPRTNTTSRSSGALMKRWTIPRTFSNAWVDCCES
jgi:hypothetical protein